MILYLEVKLMSKTLAYGIPQVETGRFAEARSHN